MQQIVDLQNDMAFQGSQVVLISIGTDPLPDLEAGAREWKVTTPLLSDPDRNVSQAYGVLQWAMPSGEPGHTFVLVGKEGKVTWIQDYGAPENGGLMYVPPDELMSELSKQLETP